MLASCSQLSAARVAPFGAVRPRGPVRARVVSVYANSTLVLSLEQIKKSRALLVNSYENDQRQQRPDIRIGDTVALEFVVLEKAQGVQRDKMGNIVKLAESDKEKIQAVSGTIIAKHGSGTNATMTLRKVFQGVGVEYIIPTHTPLLKSVKVMKSAKIRRAKLHYLRELFGKAARLVVRRTKKPETP